MEKIYQKKIESITDMILKWDDVKRIEWVESIVNVLEKNHERYIVMMLYLYGMRPIELMTIEKGSFLINAEDVTIMLPTAKEGTPRTITLSREDTPFLNRIVKYVESCSSKLLPSSWKSTTNINSVFKKISNSLGTTRLSPYIFRKFRLSYLAIRLDASAYELQNWKGAADMRSVEPYIRKKPLTKFKSRIQ